MVVLAQLVVRMANVKTSEVTRIGVESVFMCFKNYGFFAKITIIVPFQLLKWTLGMDILLLFNAF